jgi:hypothetical protein
MKHINTLVPCGRAYSTALLVLTLCAACLAGPGVSAAARQSYEQPPTLRASELLPPDMRAGPLFQVDDQVPTDGLTGHYTLRSQWGPFVAAGRELLRIRIAELPAIQQLEKVSGSQVFLDGVSRAAAKPVEAAANMVANPVQTLTNLPAGMSRFFDRVALGAQQITQAATDSSKDDSQRAEAAVSRIGSATITALGFEQTRRQLAKSLKVDPYTTNPVLAEKLTDVAWVSFSGRLAVNTLVSVFVPASIAVSATSITSDLVYDTPTADLVVMNKQKMLAMGATEAQAQALLDNPWYSLSVLTSLVTELERLSGVAGQPEVIALAATARNEEEARFLSASVRLLARSNAGGTPISQVAGRGTVIGIAPNGAVVVPAPVEYVSWTERIGGFAQRQDLRAGKRSIRLTGKMSKMAQKGFTGLDWTVREVPSP